MKILLTVLLISALLILIILIAGLMLPAERIGTSETVYKAPPEEVYKVVTSNDDYHHRSDLKEIKIIERSGDFEVWDEIAPGGNVIRFKTARKEPGTRYDMLMEADGFSGYWTGTFHETEQGGTRFAAVEKITIKNPFLRVMNRLMFDLDKFMITYQNDVRRKLGEN